MHSSRVEPDMRIVETDNMAEVWSPERFVSLPPMTQVRAEAVVDAINNGFGGFRPRHWKVVRDDYTLMLVR